MGRGSPGQAGTFLVLYFLKCKGNGIFSYFVGKKIGGFYFYKKP